MKTDEEYINNVNRLYRKRKRSGYTVIIITIVIGVLAYFTYTKSIETTDLLIDTLQGQHEGDIVRAKDINNVISTNEIVHAIGIKTGFMLGVNLALMVSLIAQVFILLFGMRKDRLLIKYYEQSKN